jgi:hypothetical protein
MKREQFRESFNTLPGHAKHIVADAIFILAHKHKFNTLPYRVPALTGIIE